MAVCVPVWPLCLLWHHHQMAPDENNFNFYKVCCSALVICCLHVEDLVCGIYTIHKMYLLSDELDSIFILHPTLNQSKSNQYRSPVCINIHTNTESRLISLMFELKIMTVHLHDPKKVSEMLFGNRMIRLQLLFLSCVRSFLANSI